MKYVTLTGAYKEENIIDKQLNKSKSISFNRNNTLTENKTNKK